ncbi:hypothetical protein BTR23_13770 [Alkalihalophilus pseudofirmus]|nr:hypothetical protein BTR23_13770 [Alkalihalophilus pseudofirmus]
MTEEPLISLCMIVKDEEESIEGCLKSVSGIVDEIIVVDTGSSDNTVSIAKENGAKVYYKEWKNSFSEARNESLKHANGKWILCLDADEQLDKKAGQQLRELLKTTRYDVLTFPMLNYYGASVSSDQCVSLGKIKCFRNKLSLKYVTDIHEQLDLSEVDAEQEGEVDIPIHHYGYLDQYVKGKKKTERNLQLVKQQLEKEDNGWMRYYLAAEYYQQKKYIEALKELDTALFQYLKKGLKPPAYIYRLKYTILVERKQWKFVREGIEKVLMLYPDYVDLWFYKGMALYNEKEYDEAIYCFEECIRLGESNLSYYTVKGVGSFNSWFYKGLCYKKLNQQDQAIISFIHSWLLSPNNKILVNEIRKIVKYFHGWMELLESNLSKVESEKVKQFFQQ